MKTFVTALGLMSVFAMNSAVAAKDAYLESLIWRTAVPKRAQPHTQEKQRVALYKFHPQAPAK